MEFLNGFYRTCFIDGLSTPLSEPVIQVFDAKKMRPSAFEVQYLEELTTPTVTMSVNGYNVEVPASWHVVVFEDQNFTIDTIPVSCSQIDENKVPGYLFKFSENNVLTIKQSKCDMIGIKYSEGKKIVHPSIPKNNAFILPVENGTILVGPYDLNRYISGRTIGELI